MIFIFNYTPINYVKIFTRCGIGPLITLRYIADYIVDLYVYHLQKYLHAK